MSILYFDKNVALKVPSDLKESNFPTCHSLTNAGREILQHLELKSSDVFVDWLEKYFKQKGFGVEITSK